ncbi:MAG: hypothetical protein QM627_11290 [Luteolibacter sp.]
MAFIDGIVYPPSGGRVKQIVLGVILPLAIGYFAYQAWVTREALWLGFGTNGTLKLDGKAAQAMALCYLAPALFAHFRWFWGLVPVYKIFEIGVVLAILVGLGGCGAAYYYRFW